MKDFQGQFIEGYVRQAAEVAASLSHQQQEISNIVDVLFRVAKSGGRIFTCGNGGSACDAMHLAEELVARYLRERPGIKAQHLIDAGTLTCWANDYTYSSVFSRQVETLMGKTDALVAFTTSGNSENIVQAVLAANKIGGISIAMCGRDGGKVKSVAQHSLVIASELTSHIQEAHVIIVHIICDLLEQRLFPECVK